MKRIVAILLALTLCFALCACGGIKRRPRPTEGTVPTGDNTAGQNQAISDELREYAELVKSAQNSETLTLSIMSDTHYCSEEQEGQSRLDTAKQMAQLTQCIQVDAVANLGDYLRGDESKGESLEDLEQLVAATQEGVNCPVFHVRGNHDDNGWYSYTVDGNPGSYLPEEMITHTEWYNTVFRHTAKDVVTDSANPQGGYGYYDHEASKIRIFLLNSVDIPYVLNGDGTYRYNSYQCYAFSNAQLNFVANALKFEDKEAPNEWAAMFLTHVPMDTTNDSYYRFGVPDALARGSTQMLAIINAYSKGSGYSFNGSVNSANAGELPEHFPVEVSVDYSEKGAGDVIGFVSGHTHTDNFSQKVGYGNSISYGFTYLSVSSSDTFATLVVDRSRGVVTVFKYGDVRSQKDSEQSNPYAINGATELGMDMSGGVWEVPFRQIRASGEDVYPGLAVDGYEINTSTTLDLSSLKLSGTTPNANCTITQPIWLKSATQYQVPPELAPARVYFFSAVNGQYNGSADVTDGKFITRNSANYVVFCFDKTYYPDYESFYLKECGNP